MFTLKSLSATKRPSKRFFDLCLRNFSVELYLLRDDDTFVAQVVGLLQHPENEWDVEQLRNLLFSETPSSPKPLFHIARRLESSSKALKFFDYLEANSNLPDDSPSLSSAFQAVLELAAREPRWEKRLAELYAMSKERNVLLTINAATLLMGCFGRAGMVEELLAVFEGLDSPCKNTHVCNKMVSVLLSLNRFDDALQVLDKMLEPNGNSRPNEVTAQIVFSSLMKRNRARKRFREDDIARLVSGLGRHGLFPGPFELTGVIASFCRRGKVDLAWEVLEGVMEAGGTVAAASCNALLTGLAKRRNLKRMNELMAKMKEKDVKPNVITFGILIDLLCKSQRVDEALEVFGRMREGGGEGGTDLVKPDVVVYNALIDGLCKVGRQEKGLSLLEEMRSGSECKPNAATYNCLIDGFNKVGDMKTAMEVFDRMKEDEVAPNVITLNTLVDTMCRQGRVNSAVVLFDEMQRDGIKGNAVTYTSLITAFCGVNNIKKAMELFDHMLRTGCSADAVVYYSLIAGLSQAGRMNEASVVVSKLKEAGFCMDIITYNVLISGFCKTNKLDKAYETLREMEAIGIKPDSVTYNTLIACLSKIGSLEIAHEVLEKMKSDGLSPTVVTYGALIHGYCVNDNTDEAMKLYEDMASRSKIPPNTVIYNILINSLCKKHDVEPALALMDDMKAKGVRPNTTTFNSLFKGLRFENSLDKALELMDQMVEQACNPDYITMEVLTEWLTAVGKIDKLMQFLDGYEVSKQSCLGSSRKWTKYMAFL